VADILKQRQLTGNFFWEDKSGELIVQGYTNITTTLSKLFFSLIFLSLLTSTISAQAAEYQVLFVAERNIFAEQTDVAYRIYFGMDAGVSKQRQCKVFAIYDKGKELSDWDIGTGEVLSIEKYWTTVGVDFKEGISADEHETVQIELTINLPQKTYQGIGFKFAQLGITITNQEDEEILSPDTSLRNDSMLAEFLTLKELLQEQKQLASSMRGQMEEPTIDGGRYAGKPLFDAMEGSTISDIKDFLHYVKTYPLKYRGKTWKFAEIYATWLINGTPTEGEKPMGLEKTPAGIGVKLAVDRYSDYLRVTGALSQFYGSLDVVKPGDLILAVDGQSVYRKGVVEVKNMLQGKAYTAVDVKLLGQTNKLKQYAIPRIPISQTGEEMWSESTQPIMQPATLYPIKENGKYGFIDATSEVIIEPQFDDVEVASLGEPAKFTEGLIAVKIGDKWGYINVEGEVVIQPQWKRIDAFSDGLAAFYLSESVFTFGGKVGYIDKTGREVIPPKYEKPVIGGSFAEGLCQVLVDDKKGFIDKTGKLVIPARFYSTNNFHEGLAVAQENEGGKYGYLNKSGSWAIPPQYDMAANFYDGLAIVTRDDAYYAIDKQGNTKITFEAKPLGGVLVKMQFVEERIRASRDGKFGYMDKTGKIVVEPKYVDAYWTYQEGLAAVTLTGEEKKNSFLKVGGWHFIDPNGNTVIEGPFEQTSYFSEERCWVMKDGKWGLIDTSGQWVVKPTLNDDAISGLPSAFKNGLSMIKLNRDTGGFLPEKIFLYCNKRGQMVWQPKE